jgi:RNA polymerase sigma factor (sigma-70 family)
MASRRAVARSVELQQVIRLGAVGTWTDGQLLERFVARGDEVAFQALLERHGAMVQGICRAVLRDPHEAQDACQATFLILLRHARSIRRTDSVAAWLHGVARRVAARAKRQAARRRVVESAAIGRETARDVHNEWLELHDEIERLPEKYRSPIILCGLESYTHEEAARQLGWPVGTVKVRLMRGRNRLRDRLVRRGLVPSALLLGALTSESPAAVATRSPLAGGLLTWKGDVPARVALLADATSRSMLMTKIKTIAWNLIATSGLVLATGWGLALAIAAKDDPVPNAAKQPEPSPPAPKPVIEKPKGPLAFEKRYEAFRFATVGNFRPILNDAKGYRYQVREIIHYKTGEVIIWSHDTKSPVCPPIRHEGAPITGIEVFDGCGGPLTSLNPDLQYLITRSDDSTRFWNGLTGAPRGELKGQVTNRQWELAYAPSTGAFVTIAKDGRSANLWDMETLRPIATFAVDSARLIAASLSKDGRFLVTFGDDRSALLWDIGSRRSFATLQPSSAIIAKVVKADGTLDKSRLDGRFWDVIRSLGPEGE